MLGNGCHSDSLQFWGKHVYINRDREIYVKKSETLTDVVLRFSVFD